MKKFDTLLKIVSTFFRDAIGGHKNKSISVDKTYFPFGSSVDKSN